MTNTHDEIKAISIAIMSTCAILLVGLLEAHLRITNEIGPQYSITAFSLAFGILFGMPMFMYIIIKSIEQDPHEAQITVKIELGFLAVQSVFLSIGAIGFVSVLLRSSHG